MKDAWPWCGGLPNSTWDQARVLKIESQPHGRGEHAAQDFLPLRPKDALMGHSPSEPVGACVGCSGLIRASNLYNCSCGVLLHRACAKRPCPECEASPPTAVHPGLIGAVVLLVALITLILGLILGAFRQSKPAGDLGSPGAETIRPPFPGGQRQSGGRPASPLRLRSSLASPPAHGRAMASSGPVRGGKGSPLNISPAAPETQSHLRAGSTCWSNPSWWSHTSQTLLGVKLGPAPPKDAAEGT